MHEKNSNNNMNNVKQLCPISGSPKFGINF